MTPTCTGCGCLRPGDPVDCRLCPVPGCEGCIGDDGLCMTCRDTEKESRT